MEGSKRVGCSPWIRNFIDVKLFEIVLMFAVSTITDEILLILNFVILAIPLNEFGLKSCHRMGEQKP